MKRLLLSAVLLVSVFAVTAAQNRVPIQEDKAVEMYALGAGGNMGVFKFIPTDWAHPTKLNGTTYVQYTGSSVGGGGTFLSSEKVVGVKYNYSPYPFEASAEGNENGEWGESYFKKSDYIDKVYDMTYDEKNDVIYCWYNVSAYIKTLGIYDPATHNITRVGSAANVNIYALAIDNDGELWGVGEYGLFYSIDKTTAKATELTGNMGCGAQLYATMPASAAIDPATNVLYLVARTGLYNAYSSLYKIDLTTHKAEFVSNLDKYYNCLYIAGSSINENAPASVENLSATFNGEATVVSFTAPTLTYGGKTLSGDLTYSVKVDGDEVATGTVAAGAEANVSINPENGNHEIQVTVSNNAGESKGAKINFFSGYDQPGAVGSFKAEPDFNKVALSWSAPVGKNGGVPDMSKISYTVSVDGTPVATGLTATEYTCELDEFYSLHTIQVTVVVDGAEGESVSASVMAGNPYEVPFALDLDAADSLGAAGITVIDLDHVNSGKWQLAKTDGSTYLESYSTPVFQRNDFAYLPYMALKAGASYTLDFKAAAMTKVSMGLQKTAEFRIVIASEPTGDSNAYTVLADYKASPVMDEYEWNDYSATFTVEADGNYTIAIEDYAPEIYMGYHYLAAKDFAVSANYHTPKAVGELKAVTQAGNNRNVDLSFVLPTEDTEGSALSTLTKVEIFRGDELLKTLEGSFTPGEAMSYTDEDAPRGITEYNVKVYNGEEVSAPASVTVAVGYAANLKIETVSAPDGAVEPNGAGVITVKVTNDGYEPLADGDYEVVLLCNGEPADKYTGTALGEDASAEFSFRLEWTGATPASASYVVKVELAADEFTDDNATEAVEVHFVTGKPEAVGNLTVATQPDNNRNIDIKFDLPTKDIAGASLTSISKVEIIRGTTTIKTFEGSFTPGEAMSYTDENAPRGIKNYSVVVYNGEYASATASASVMVGYLKNLSIELISAPAAPVEAGTEAFIKVKVTNDGFEAVSGSDYNVVLLLNGAMNAVVPGSNLATDESAEFSLDLIWEGETPATVEYSVKIEFDGDEDTSDNITAPVSVTFEKPSGVENIAAGNVVIGAEASSITVKGAEGKLVTIYTLQGQIMVSETAGEAYVTAPLPSGVYIVTVGRISKKIAL